MKLIETRKLSGRKLDYAVAVAQGYNHLGHYPLYNPSSCWEACGFLIEKYLIRLIPTIGGWQASVGDNEVMKAETPQEAVCLAIVVSKLGNEIKIPEMLLE